MTVEKSLASDSDLFEMRLSLKSMKDFLSYGQVESYKRRHKATRNQKKADRIKAILMLNSGYSMAEISEVLLLDESTIWRWYKVFDENGIKGLLEDNYQGGTSKLTPDQLIALDHHLANNIYQTTQEICSYILNQFGCHYTKKGVTNLLHRLGYSYKKPKHVPGKADKQAQEEFIKKYYELKQDKDPSDQIYFVDGVHPLHNSQPAYGWMKKNCDYTLKSNTGRRRININGAVNIQNMRVIYREDETIDSISAINLFEQILQSQEHGLVYLILDNARYYKSEVITKYLEKNPRLKPVYLPAYSPNLNIIERLWRFLKKNVTYNKYYEKFAKFREAIIQFLNNLENHEQELRSLLTDNFQIIEAN